MSMQEIPDTAPIPSTPSISPGLLGDIDAPTANPDAPLKDGDIQYFDEEGNPIEEPNQQQAADAQAEPQSTEPSENLSPADYARMQVGEKPIAQDSRMTPADEARISAGEPIPQKPSTSESKDSEVESGPSILSKEEYEELGVFDYIDVLAEFQNNPKTENRDFMVIKNGKPYWVVREPTKTGIDFKFMPLRQRPHVDQNKIPGINWHNYEIDRRQGFLVCGFTGERGVAISRDNFRGIVYFDKDRGKDGNQKIFSGIHQQDLSPDELKSKIREIIPSFDEVLDAKNNVEISRIDKEITRIREQKREAFESTIPFIQQIGALQRQREVLNAKKNSAQPGSVSPQIDQQIVALDMDIQALKLQLAEQTHTAVHPITEAENELLVLREEYRQMIRERHNGVVPDEYRLLKPDYLPGQLDDIRARRNAEREAMAPKPIVPYSAPASADQDDVEEGVWRELTPDELNNHRVAGAPGSPTAAPKPLLEDHQMTAEVKVDNHEGPKDLFGSVSETVVVNRGLMQEWGQDTEGWAKLAADPSLREYMSAVNDWNNYPSDENALHVKECSDRLRELASGFGLQVDLPGDPKRKVPI